MKPSASSGLFRLGAKPPSSPTLVLWPASCELLLQGVENLRAHAQRLAEARRAHRHDHEFLEVDGIVGMHAAIDDVHHRHRQKLGLGAADIAVERQARSHRRRLRHRQRHAQNGVGAQPRLVGRAVERDHRRVDARLLFGIHAAERVEDFAVHGGDGLFHALAAIAFAAVAQFHRLMRAGRGARGHRGAAETAVFQPHIHFHGGIAPGVQDFPAGDIEDGGHEVPFSRFLRRLYGKFAGFATRPARAATETYHPLRFNRVKGALLEQIPCPVSNSFC